MKLLDKRTVPVMIRHSRSKYVPHQGAQEKARRVRQMERGIIQGPLCRTILESDE